MENVNTNVESWIMWTKGIFVESCEVIMNRLECKPMGIDVLKNSLKIPEEGIEVITQKGNRLIYKEMVSRLSLDEESIGKIGTYAVSGNFVMFVQHNGTFITINRNNILVALIKNGFKERDYYIPLSGEEKILNKAMERKWKKILQGDQNGN